MITIICFIVAGLAAGVLQFVLLRLTVEKMLKGNRYWLLLPHPLLPAVVFITAALIDAKKLYIAAVAYTAALLVSTVVNLIRTKSKKD